MSCISENPSYKRVQHENFKGSVYFAAKMPVAAGVATGFAETK